MAATASTSPRWATGCSGCAPGETWWSTSDIGWIVGHSYIVYAPLMAGATTIAWEGALDHPDADNPWSIIEREGVTGVFSSPTAIRLLMRYGEDIPRRHDLGRLERMFSAGEVLNAPAWEWLQRTVFEDRVPVIDHMWQTETGGPIFGNPYGLGLLPIKPGSAGLALPGIEADVVDNDGRPVGVGEKGIMRIVRPFPGLIATLWGEPERYVTDYWAKIPGGYYVGDAAHVDDDGYVWFAGRADEIIKIADHRIGTIEVETAFLRHPAVAEAGVTGVPDELRGQVIEAFVALRAGHEPSEELRRELIQTVRHELGPLAVIKHVSFVAMLPKTRSGKIMRRVLKAVAARQRPRRHQHDRGRGLGRRGAARRSRSCAPASCRDTGRGAVIRGRCRRGLLRPVRDAPVARATRRRRASASHPAAAPSSRHGGAHDSSRRRGCARRWIDGWTSTRSRTRRWERPWTSSRSRYPTSVDDLADAFAALPLVPEAAEAVSRLRAAGLTTGILTNASARTLDRVAARIGIPFDHLLSVDAARRFKPHPDVYRLAVDATGFPPERIGFVTANGWDAAGAGTFGFRVAWLRADPAARLPPVGAPEPVIASWPELIAMFVTEGRGP